MAEPPAALCAPWRLKGQAAKRRAGSWGMATPRRAVQCNVTLCVVYAMAFYIMPRTAMPSSATPWHAVSRCTTQCHTTPWRAVRRPATLPRVAVCHAAPRRALPCRTCCAVPWHGPCSAVSCHGSPRLRELPTPLTREPQHAIFPLSHQLHGAQHLPCSRGGKALTPLREGQWSPGASANPHTPWDLPEQPPSNAGLPINPRRSYLCHP